MEDSILINSNVAYHIYSNTSQHEYENLIKNYKKEGVQFEVGSEAMHRVTHQHLSMDNMDTTAHNHQSLNKLAIDKLKKSLKLRSRWSWCAWYFFAPYW